MTGIVVSSLISILLLALLEHAFAQTPLPACRYDDLETPLQSYDDWQKTLLDPIYTLAESYVPPDLVLVSELGLSGDYKLRQLVMVDLLALLKAAEAAGVYLELQSAYRSYSYQEQTFQHWIDEEGYDNALKSSARAGHSEHQLGTALDFKTGGGPAPWDIDDWAQTLEGGWLSEHAWHYGFVMSYPRGKETLTCYRYEPWHYRYVGRDSAAAIHENGLSLREWLWQQNSP